MAEQGGQYTVVGRVMDAVTRKPVAGLRVRAWDKDRILDDPLDEDSTAADGTFKITFDASQFQEPFLDDEPDLYFKVFDGDKEIASTKDSVLWNVKSHDLNVEIEVELPAGTATPAVTRRVGLAPAHALSGDEKLAGTLKTLGLETASDLLAMDVRRLAGDPRAAAAGLTTERLNSLKSRAHLSAVAQDADLAVALEAAGVRSIVELANASLPDLGADIRKAISTRGLNVTPASTPDLQAAQARARSLHGLLVQSAVAGMVLADTDCRRCGDECGGVDPSVLSKDAYLGYLARKFGRDVTDLEARFHQDFSAPSCAEAHVIRIGIEVLERACLAGDFEGVSARAVLRLMLAERMVVRRALLSRLARVRFDDPRVAQEANEFKHNKPDCLRLETDGRLRGATAEAEALNRGLTDFLKARSNLGRELIEAAWLRATTADFDGAALDLEPEWAAELKTLGRPDPDRANPAARVGVHNFARLYRAHLVALTRQSASRLREKYHVNFLADEGRLSRCDQAILTLQGAMRCGDAWYVECCEDGVEGFGTRFKEYGEYQLWIARMLYPQNFYDLHVKSPLVRGDVAVLKQQLKQAEDILEARTRDGGEPKTSLMGLFRQGLQTVRNLLGIDELINRGHTASRDEEYGLAVALYTQAQERIRQHVQTYHSRTLVTYEEMFYGSCRPCGGGEDRVCDAAELCEVLRRASIRPALVRQLIPDPKLAALDVDGWLPRMDELPTREEWLNYLQYMATNNDPGFSLWNRFFVRARHLDELKAARQAAGWIAFDYPGGLRYTPPLIAHHDEGLFKRGVDDIELRTRAYLLQIFKTEIESFLNAQKKTPPDLSSLFNSIVAAFAGVGIIVTEFLGRASKVKEAVDSFVPTDLGTVKDWIRSAFTSCSEASGRRTKRDPITGRDVPDPYSVSEFINCMAGKIVAEVEARIEPPPQIPSFDTVRDGWNRIGDELRGKVEAELDRLTRVPGLLDASAGRNLDASTTYLIETINDVGTKILKDDQSIWGVRDGQVQELSNLTQLGEVRDESLFRSGTLLLDAKGIGDPAYDSYIANFVLRADDDDDFGVVFCVRHHGTAEKPRYSYYRLSMRNNGDDEAARSAEKGLYFSMYGGLLKQLAETFAAVALSMLGSPQVQYQAKTLFITAGAIFPAVVAVTEANNRSAFPYDRARQFVKLTRVDASKSPVDANEPPPPPDVRVLWESGAGPDLKTDYEIKIEVQRLRGQGLKIYAKVAPRGSKEPLAEFSEVDPQPLDPGGVGLYSFSNRASIFSKASVTIFPWSSGDATLGEVLFLPGGADRERPRYDCRPYECRLASTLDALAEEVQVKAGAYRLVYVRGPEGTSFGKDEDPVNLRLYGLEDSVHLNYSAFDSYVDRHLLAQLANDLLKLLPHQYFFILPLSIADALHAAGDYEGAKKHYDIIYDPFANEIERHGHPGVSYGDPASRAVGYSFLHSDVPQRQLGIEEALLRTRQAANALAAGEAAFTQNTPESRRRAYEFFSRVMLIHGRTQCCSAWGGEVMCVPGAKDSPTPPPSQARSQLPAQTASAEPRIRPELDGCRDRVQELLELSARLGASQRDVLKEVLAGLSDPHAPITCEQVAEAVAEARQLLRRARSISVGTREGRKALAPIEFEFPGVVADFALTGGGDFNRLGPKAAGPAGAHTPAGVAPASAPADEINAPMSEPCAGRTVDCLERAERAIFLDLSRAYGCVPQEPLKRRHLELACLYLRCLDEGLNVLGLREEHASAYRYEHLVAMARSYASNAINAEKDFIQFREKLASSRITYMQQEHSAQLLGAQLRVQQLAVAQASLQLKLSDYQLGLTEKRDDHLNRLLALNDVAMTLAALSAVAGITQGLFGLAGAGVGVAGAAGGLVVAGAGVVAAYPTGGWSLVGSVAGLGVAGLGAVGAVGGVGAAGAGLGAGVTAGLQGVFNVYQQRVMLEQQQELLRNYELPAARLAHQNAQLQELVTRRQMEIGQTQISFARDVLTYMANQFLNAEMYAFLAKQSKRNYRQYLAYATRAALMAERALEVERAQTYNLIKLDYFDVSVQGLMGGEELVRDIETLEYQRLVRDDRKHHPPVKIFSLANKFPLEFESFRHTGELWFRTDHIDFDLDFPGHYHRQIKSVRVIIIALVGVEGVKATLAQVGPSEVVEPEDGAFKVRALPGLYSSFALAGSPDGRGLIPLNPSADKLNPFEGTGVAATWLLTVPPGANQFDFSTVADVQFLVEYTSYSDDDYRRALQQELQERPQYGSRVFSWRLSFPDNFYHLLNPSPAGPETISSQPINFRTAAVHTTARLFPPNHKSRVLDKFALAFFNKDGQTTAVENIRLATGRQLAALWRAGAFEREVSAIDPAAEPGKVRVMRGGELLKVSQQEVRPGEVASSRRWRRVLRGKRLVWVPEGDTAFPPAPLNPAITPMPQIIPADLFRTAQVKISRSEGVDPYTGVTKHLFSLKVRDDGTPPSFGQKRILRDGELIWVNARRPGEQELAAGEWVRALSGTSLTWVPWASNPAPSVVFDLDDIWFITLDPADNPAMVSRSKVQGHDVLDLSDLFDILMVVDYRYSLF